MPHCKDFATEDAPGKELALGLSHATLDLVRIKFRVAPLKKNFKFQAASVKLNVVGRTRNKDGSL